MGNLANISVEPCSVSWAGTDLGFTDGDLDIKPKENAVEITAHQEGSNILDAIRTGKSLELAVTLKETSPAQVAAMIGAGGASAVTAVAEISTVTCVADVAGSLNNKYLFLWDGNGAPHYFWFNIGGLGVDPAPASPDGQVATGHVVAAASSASATTIATALKAIVDATAEFIAVSSGALVTVTNAVGGSAHDVFAGNSTFTVAVLTQGIDAVAAWGNSKDFKNQFADSDKLVLHPTAKAATDLSSDFCAWKAYPMLDSIVQSGEKEKMVKITFKVFPDPTRAPAARLFIIGDHR